MGLDLQQLSDNVICISLKRIGLFSPAAAQLVLGTAVVESRVKYLRQLGNGPAVGIFQMEPFTHDDIYKNVLAYNKSLKMDVLALTKNPNAVEMTGNLFYAAAMCRVQYYRFSEALPVLNDFINMAKYHKKYYNTVAGATDTSESTEIFERIMEINT